MKRSCLLLGVALAISACSGQGQSPTPVSLPAAPAPNNAPASGAAGSKASNFSISATLGATALPALFASARNGRSTDARRRLAASTRRTPDSQNFSTVKVTGTLYPSYAGAEPISNTITYQSGTPLSNVTVPFSNVPTGNNEWATFDFQGVAGDGSTVDLGQLAGLFNVSNTSTSTTLDVGKTFRYQLAIEAAALRDPFGRRHAKPNLAR